MFKQFHILPFVPFVSCPVTGQLWEKPSSLFFILPFIYLYTPAKIPLSFLSSRMNIPSSLRLSYDRCCNLLILCLALQWLSPVCTCLLYWGACVLDRRPQMWLYECWAEGKDHFHQLAGNAFNTTQDAVGLLCCTDLLLAHFQLGVPQDLSSFSARLYSSQSAPRVPWSIWLFFPRCRTLLWALLNYIRFPSDNFSSLSTSLWKATQPFDVSTTPQSFLSSADSLRECSASSFRSLIMMLLCWSQCRPLVLTTRGWSPAGLHITSHNPLSPPIQLAFNPCQFSI